MKQEPYHELNTTVVHSTTIFHMVSEHMERDLICAEKKHLTSFGLVSLVLSAKLTAHILCTTRQLEDDFVQNTFSSLATFYER